MYWVLYQYDTRNYYGFKNHWYFLFYSRSFTGLCSNIRRGSCNALKEFFKICMQNRYDTLFCAETMYSVLQNYYDKAKPSTLARLSATIISFYICEKWQYCHISLRFCVFVASEFIKDISDMLEQDVHMLVIAYSFHW